MSVLPNELVIEILTRLPGKQVGRCRCVCKPWRAMIGSRLFLKIYRERQRGLLLCWPEDINRVRRLRFFHFPLRRLEEPREEFSPLGELEFSPLLGLESRGVIGLTQVVNGLLCVGEADDISGLYTSLTIRNICTGEMMRVPNPLPCVDNLSSYHLGYDPVNGVYKLLRLMFSIEDEFSIQRAQILTVRPPSRSLSTWRELDYEAYDLRLIGTNCLYEVVTSPDDGMLCWVRASLKEGLLSFDLNRERFQVIDCPEPGMQLGAVTRFKESLALWLFDQRDDRSVISCYVQQNNDEGKNWSVSRVHHAEVLKELREKRGLASGNRLSFSTSGELLVMNHDQSWLVYPYSRQHTQHKDKDGVFIVGKLPDGAPDLNFVRRYHHWHRCFQFPYGYGPFCFMEGNNIFLPLDDVLGGGTAIM